ncbi:MAG: hypothetical protein U0694_04880 [Anaerolineae bacterium]
MFVFTIRNLHLSPQNFGDYPEIVCQNVDLLSPSPNGRFVGSQETGFHWYDLSRERLAHLKATLESFGAAPEIEEQQLKFDFDDWIQLEGVAEGYQLKVSDAFGMGLIIYRISSKQVQSAYTKPIVYRDELFLREFKQKPLDTKMWLGFCEFLEDQKFWASVDWIADPEVAWLDGLSYTFTGCKDELTKTLAGNNEPKFEKVAKFLNNLLKTD